MPPPRGHCQESWEWDPHGKPPDTHLSTCHQAVYFHISPLLESQGTAAVRGTKDTSSMILHQYVLRFIWPMNVSMEMMAGDFQQPTGFTHGEHYWEIKFLEPLYGVSVMVGVGTVKAPLHAGDKQFINLIGMDTESWGLSYKGFLWHEGKSRKYTEPFYDKNTVIGVLLDRAAGTLTFYHNGENLGLAFCDLDKVGPALYPMVSSTAPETELQLGVRTARLSSLQDHCIHTITHRLGCHGSAHALPLPAALRRQIHPCNTHR